MLPFAGPLRQSCQLKIELKLNASFMSGRPRRLCDVLILRLANKQNQFAPKVRVTGAVNFNYAHSSAHKLLLLWQRGASIWTPFPIRSTRPHSTQTSRHPFALTSHIHIHNQIAIKWAKAWLRINDNGVSVAMCGKWAGGGKWSLNRSEVQSNKTN